MLPWSMGYIEISHLNVYEFCAKVRGKLCAQGRGKLNHLHVLPDGVMLQGVTPATPLSLGVTSNPNLHPNDARSLQSQ